MKITDLTNYKVIGGTNTGIPNSSIGVRAKKSLGQKVLDAGTSVSNFFGGKGLSELEGAAIAKFRAKPEEKKYIESPGPKEVGGSLLQLGANFLPGAGVGAKIATKVGIGAGTGLAFDAGSQLQDPNKKASEVRPGVGTVVGGSLPVAGSVARLGGRIVGRLFKGLGSGLSGVSTSTIDKIIDNPKVAQLASEKLAKSGNSKILEENAKQIVGGVSKVRQEARQSFGKAMDELKTEDIDPKKFRSVIQPALDEIGSVTQGNTRRLNNVEFSDPANLKRANTLINDISNVKLDGLSLRKLVYKIENTKFKTATSDERLSFNAFTKDLASSVKEAITGSTDKLTKANESFTKDMQLVETIEDIFGNVKFKNLPEVVKASQKLEGLFAQKGLAPDVVDDFLERIGVNAKNFKTTEAVRQISGKSSNANTKGLSVGEMMQQTTSAVVTPEMVKNISIGAGMTKEKLADLVNKMNPAAKKIFIQTLLPSPEAKKVATPMVTNLAIATGLAKEQLVPFLNSLAPAARNALIQALIQQNSTK